MLLSWGIFLGNLLVLVKLSLTTSAEVPGSTPGHG